MKRIYGAIIRQDEDGGCWAEVPDLPGCYGQGDTIIDATTSVSNGVETHLAAMLEDGESIPDPTEVSSDDGKVVYVYADTDAVDLGAPSVTATEAASRLGLSAGRVSQLVSSGKLDGRRTPIGMMVTVDSIESYANEPRLVGRPRKVPAIA